MAEYHDIDLWREQAACRGADTAIWFDDRHRHTAALICNQCPVQQQCHNYATSNKEQYGVWGGDTSRLRNNHRHPNPRRRNQNSDGYTTAELVADALNHDTWATAGAIADRVDRQRNTVHKALRRLTATGVVEHHDGGYYRLTKRAAADVEVGT
jgi:WhiB family redox-sensing transcriptional regulator